MGIHEVEDQLTFPFGRCGLQTEQNREGMAPAAGPDIRRPRLDVRPVLFRIGLPGDEHGIVREGGRVLVAPVRPQGKLRRMIVGLTNIPK